MSNSRRSYWKTMVLGIAAITLAPISTAWPGIYCVSDAVDLQTALNTAASSADDDEIRMQLGTYFGEFRYLSGNDGDLRILGGYNASDCTSRILDPSTYTILDGSALVRPLWFSAYPTLTNITINGVTLRNGDSTTSGAGGGLFVSTGGSVNISSSEITNNNGGGGAYINAAGGVTLENNLIDSNVSSSSGGGLSIWVGSGGIGAGGPIKIAGNTISNNSASSGGGVFIDCPAGCVLSFLSNTLVGNIAESMAGGGGLHQVGGSTGYPTVATYSNNLIAANVATASLSHGGGLAAQLGDFSSLIITNNTVTDNGADSRGGVDIGGYPTDAAVVDIRNNIIWNNAATDGLGGDLWLNFFTTDFSLVTLLKNDFDWSRFDINDFLSQLTIDPSNLNNEDPLFVDPLVVGVDPLFVDGVLVYPDYHISTSTSPVIDAGDNGAPGLPALDLDGNDRIVDGDGDGVAVVDMGTYEREAMSCSVYLDKKSCQSDASCTWEGRPNTGLCVEAPPPVDCSAYDGDRAACKGQPSCRWSPKDNLCLTK